MTQAELLKYTKRVVAEHYSGEDQVKVAQAMVLIDNAVTKFGNAGMMALALCGLEQAARAEAEEVPPIMDEEGLARMQ